MGKRTQAYRKIEIDSYWYIHDTLNDAMKVEGIEYENEDEDWIEEAPLVVTCINYNLESVEVYITKITPTTIYGKDTEYQNEVEFDLSDVVGGGLAKIADYVEEHLS